MTKLSTIPSSALRRVLNSEDRPVYVLDDLDGTKNLGQVFIEEEDDDDWMTIMIQITILIQVNLMILILIIFLF